jgi:exodeoxyribonuclease VII small subunit
MATVDPTSPSTDVPPDQAPGSFESALAELEKIVQSMESAQLSLEQSLTLHRRGVELAKYCQAVLARAQAQVRVLEEDSLKALPRDDAEG